MKKLILVIGITSAFVILQSRGCTGPDHVLSNPVTGQPDIIVTDSIANRR